MGSFDILKAAEEHRQQVDKLRWEGTFADYLEIIRENPRTADLAHARVYDMILSAGVEDRPGQPGVKDYKFFDNDIYGLDKTLTHLVEEYFSPASRRLDIRKRILMLVGPVGGGKSTLVTLIKKGMEKYSKADGGAVYSIVGCPMHEEPLHLIPEDLRDDFKREYGVYIEGDLCPVCRYRLKGEWGGDISKVPVQRISFSERDRRGIGTFKPADPKSQDVAELTGSVNIQALAELGNESDPRVYNFDGELNIANRGVMEFIEMLKAEKRFLYELNTVAGEQTIKASRFALIYADLCVLAHTNEYEYNSYFGNKENEAMIDRIFVVKVPYNLQLSQEIRIYDKLISQSQLSDERIDLSRVHIERPGLTYTIDTLRDLHADRPEAELFFITGADALAQILSWKDADELFELAHFIGVTRPGYPLSESGLPDDRVTLQEVPAMAISSTDCRARVERSEPVWYLVPDGVVQYINKYRLYAAGSPAAVQARQ